MFRRVAFFLYLLIALPVSGQFKSQPSEVQVVAMDENNRAIAGAQVQILNFSGSVADSYITDREGRARFRLQPGTFTIRISGEGLQESRTELRLGLAETYRNEMITVRRAGAAGEGTLKISKAVQEDVKKGNDALNAGQLDKAEKSFRSALNVAPFSPEALNGLGIVALRRGDLKEAKGRFQNAIDADKYHPTGYLNLARLLLRENKPEEAVPLLRHSVTINVDDPDAQLQLAIAEFGTGHCDKAIENAAKVHALGHEGFEMAHIVAATCYEKLSNPIGAMREYQTYLDEAPKGKRASEARAALERLRTTNLKQ